MTESGVLLQQVVNGLSLGAMYALLALGFTLVYGILELINFAHFNVFMVASFIGMWALQLLGISGQSQVWTGAALAGALAFAFFVTMVAAGVIGVLIERFSLRPLRGVRGTAAMITTIGVSYILFNIVLLTVGAGSENYPNPLPVVRWQLGQVTVELKELLIWGVALALMIGLHLFVSRTRLGKAMRATAQDAEAARMMGVNVDRVIVTAFFLGSALAGVDLWPLLQLHELYHRLYGRIARLHRRGARRHRQHPGRDGGRFADRADRDPRRPADRGALDRRDHLLDPGVGFGLRACRPVRSRQPDEIVRWRKLASRRRSRQQPCARGRRPCR
jgi:branched-chain amino acid transport system permease protein